MQRNGSTIQFLDNNGCGNRQSLFRIQFLICITSNGCGMSKLVLRQFCVVVQAYFVFWPILILVECSNMAKVSSMLRLGRKAMSTTPRPPARPPAIAFQPKTVYTGVPEPPTGPRPSPLREVNWFGLVWRTAAFGAVFGGLYYLMPVTYLRTLAAAGRKALNGTEPVPTHASTEFVAAPTSVTPTSAPLK